MSIKLPASSTVHRPTNDISNCKSLRHESTKPSLIIVMSPKPTNVLDFANGFRKSKGHNFQKEREAEDEDGSGTQTSCLSSIRLTWNIDYLKQQSLQSQAFNVMGSKSYTGNIDVLMQGLPPGRPFV